MILYVILLNWTKTTPIPQVKGLGELADKELGEVAEKAMDAYDDPMDPE